MVSHSAAGELLKAIESPDFLGGRVFVFPE